MFQIRKAYIAIPEAMPGNQKRKITFLQAWKETRQRYKSRPFDFNHVKTCMKLPIKDICEINSLILVDKTKVGKTIHYRYVSEAYVKEESFIGWWMEVSDKVTIKNELYLRTISVRDKTGHRFSDLMSKFGPIYSSQQGFGVINLPQYDPPLGNTKQETD